MRPRIFVRRTALYTLAVYIDSKPRISECREIPGFLFLEFASAFPGMRDSDTRTCCLAGVIPGQKAFHHNLVVAVFNASFVYCQRDVSPVNEPHSLTNTSSRVK